MIFESPLGSPEQKLLLELAAGAELDRGAVEKLFWLIDAHPRLLAFAQIAENLTAILDTAAPFTEVAEREVKKLPLLVSVQVSPVVRLSHVIAPSARVWP
mgnify:CR=1 FL=1